MSVVETDILWARYAVDLDGWLIHALIGTASWTQASTLRDALYRHLTAQLFIGVQFAVRISSLRQPFGGR